MFKGLLEEVVRSTDGGIAALVMGYDGIPVDHYIRDDAPIDVESIGMEFSVILKDIQKAALMLDAGNAQEVAIRAERMTTVIRLVSDQFFLALALAPSGNLGKARYVLRTHASTVREQLA